MTMNRRVPVETAIKSRMHRARSFDVPLIREYVARLVGIFFLNALQCQFGEPRGLLWVQRCALLGRGLGRFGPRGARRQGSGGGQEQFPSRRTLWLGHRGFILVASD